MKNELLILLPGIALGIIATALAAWPRRPYNARPDAGESNDGYSQKLMGEWEEKVRRDRTPSGK
ncbi:MAG TPA: hypothetical protein VF189_03265 [Patescibacteria group bacterium]